MACDIISEIAFGKPFGFVETNSDVGGLVKSFHDGIPLFNFLARIYPFTRWIKETWIGEKYLVAKPEDNYGIGILMKFRDQLITQRIRNIEMGKASHRVDLLQT